MKLFCLDEQDYIFAEHEEDARQHRLEVNGEETDVIEEIPLSIICTYRPPAPSHLKRISAEHLVQILQDEGLDFPLIIDVEPL